MKPLKKFFEAQEGNATIELTLWLPFLFTFFLAIGEMGMVYYGQSQVLSVAQDATRQASIGHIQTAEEVETYIVSRLAMTDSAAVTNQVNRGIITTSVTVPANDLAPFGVFTNMVMENVTVVAQQVAEF